MDLSEITKSIKSKFGLWGQEEPNFRPTAMALLTALPKAARTAELEKTGHVCLSELSKKNLSDLMGIAEQCKRHLKTNGDNLLACKLTAAMGQVKSKFFDLKPAILPPMVDDDSSAIFGLHVKAVVSLLPLDVQKRVGDEAYFIELSPDKVQGVFANTGNDRRKICISGGLSKDRLRSTIAHECAHLFLNHTCGGYCNEKKADELAEQWGFTD